MNRTFFGWQGGSPSSCRKVFTSCTSFAGVLDRLVADEERHHAATRRAISRDSRRRQTSRRCARTGRELFGCGAKRHLRNLEDLALVGEPLLGERQFQDVERFVEALPALLARHADGVELRLRRRRARARSWCSARSRRYRDRRSGAPAGSGCPPWSDERPSCPRRDALACARRSSVQRLDAGWASCHRACPGAPAPRCRRSPAARPDRRARAALRRSSQSGVAGGRLKSAALRRGPSRWSCVRRPRC